MAEPATAAGAVAYGSRDETRAYSILKASDRDASRFSANQAVSAHHQALDSDLRHREGSRYRDGVPTLLDDLTGNRGMAWVDIARLVGVSVSAVRKWRRGGDASADNRRQLARLAALLDMLQEYSVDDPASWLEMNLALPAGYFIRALDLYAAGHVEAVFDLASLRRSPDGVMDDVDPRWREKRSEYEVYDAADGHKAIRRRGN